MSEIIELKFFFIITRSFSNCSYILKPFFFKVDSFQPLILLSCSGGISVSCGTADSHQKMNTVTTGVTTQIWLYWIFLLFFYQKMRKNYDNFSKIFNKRIIYRNWYLFIFDTKMTISPCKVRHISPSQDVWPPITFI